MRKTLVLTLFASALLTGSAIYATSAGAHSVRATLDTGLRGAFTLNQARRVAVTYQRQLGLAGRVGACRWIDRHDAGCPATYNLVVIDGQPPQRLTFMEVVTRSGPCSLPGKITHRRGLTIVTGGRHHYGNCFSGPLVVLQGAA
jgi:hypothetical protein